MQRSNLAFKEKIIAAWGTKGWEQFNDNEHGYLRVAPPRDLDTELARAQNYRIRETGDTAVCKLPGEQDAIHLARHDGRWTVALRETMALPAEKVKQDGEFYAAMAQLVRAKMQRIGADGVTPESLDREMGEAIQPLLEAAER